MGRAHRKLSNGSPLNPTPVAGFGRGGPVSRAIVPAGSFIAFANESRMPISPMGESRCIHLGSPSVSFSSSSRL